MPPIREFVFFELATQRVSLVCAGTCLCYLLHQLLYSSSQHTSWQFIIIFMVICACLTSPAICVYFCPTSYTISARVQGMSRLALTQRIVHNPHSIVNMLLYKFAKN